MIRASWLLVAPLLGLALGCGSSEPLPAACNLDYDCGAGQTCATSDGTTFTCRASGGDPAGSACSSDVNAPPTCGSGLACLGMVGPPGGVCTAWCSSTHPCAPDETCITQTTTKGASVKICAAGLTNGCNVAYDCDAGETCVSQNGVTFACAPAGPNLEGASCSPLSSTAPCADRLTCVQTNVSDPGTCVEWCSDTLACTAGEVCTTLTSTQGASLRLCH